MAPPSSPSRHVTGDRWTPAVWGALILLTSFQVGGAIVLAVVSAVVGNGTASGSDAGRFLDASHTAVGVVTGVAVLGLVSALSGVTWRRRTALAAETLGA